LYLLDLTNKILENYFEDSKVIEYVADDLKNFLKIDIAKTDPWYILVRKIKSAVDKDAKITKEVEKIIC
jgi:hypothetical protein